MVLWSIAKRRCLGSGRPRGPQKPSQRVGAEGPHILEWFLGPPGPPRPQISTIFDRPKNHVLINPAETPTGPKIKKNLNSWPIVGLIRPQNHSRSTGFVLQFRLHQKSAPQTNYKAVSQPCSKNGRTPDSLLMASTDHYRHPRPGRF